MQCNVRTHRAHMYMLCDFTGVGGPGTCCATGIKPGLSKDPTGRYMAVVIEREAHDCNDFPSREAIRRRLCLLTEGINLSFPHASSGTLTLNSRPGEVLGTDVHLFGGELELLMVGTTDSERFFRPRHVCVTLENRHRRGPTCGQR